MNILKKKLRPEESQQEEAGMRAEEIARQVAAVLKHNKRQQEKARELNTRAGEEVFTTYSRTELSQWLTPRLGSAKRLVEITDPTALYLPDLDTEMVQIVETENPLEVSVSGTEYEVEYRSGRTPRIVLGKESDGTWASLPDEGVKTPGGREIEIVVSYAHYHNFAETNIPKLKGKVREYLNKERWNSWDKPEISLPDFTDHGVEIPLVTAVYGQCATTGEDLIAYGTLRATGCSNPNCTNCSPFTAEWFKSRDEAEELQAKSVAKIGEIQSALREQQELAEAKSEAESARERLKEFASHDDWEDLQYEIRDEAKDKYYWSSLPSGLEALREDLAETEALITKVEAGLADIRLQRERFDSALAQVETLEEEYGSEASLVVLENGSVLVDCAATEDDTEYVTVSNSIGDPSWNEPESFHENSETKLQMIQSGKQIQLQECDWNDEVLCEAVFTVPENLHPGFWAAGDDGRVFYPIIGWKNGKPVVPRSFEVVTVESKTTVTAEDLTGLFGGNVRFK